MRVDSTLPGGRTALVNMRVGDRWLVVLPPEQAFGLAGREPDIGPNETVIVDVDVLEIEK
jgi:FKBP-type peptidyl-prolyl cis-trans isomerase FklB